MLKVYIQSRLKSFITKRQIVFVNQNNNNPSPPIPPPPPTGGIGQMIIGSTFIVA